MKFTGQIIITPEGVKGKEDNIFGEKPNKPKKKGLTEAQYESAYFDYESLFEHWQEAEANRKEYFVGVCPKGTTKYFENVLHVADKSGYFPFEDSDRIEGEIVDNLITNIKLI